MSDDSQAAGARPLIADVGSTGGAGNPATVVLPNLTKETWEYLELKLWAKISRKLWISATYIITLMGILAALGLNSLIQSKVDASLQSSKTKIEEFTEFVRSRSDSFLALEAIHFYLAARLDSDVTKYLYVAEDVRKVLASDKYKEIREFPVTKKLVGPFEGTGIGTITAEEFKTLAPLLDRADGDTRPDTDKSRPVGSPSIALDPNSDQVGSKINRLALFYRHIVALRETLRSIEKFAFSAVKYEPYNLAKLYEETVYPIYASALKKSGSPATAWSGYGIHYINSLQPEAHFELETYFPISLDFSEPKPDTETRTPGR